MKTPKWMTSKFRGHCDTCGRDVAAGESIYWKSRGVIDCEDCASGSAPSQPSGPQPIASDAKVKRDADAFGAALTWDDAPPDAGASLGANRVSYPATGVSAIPCDNMPAQPIESQRFIDTRTGDIVTQVPVSEIAHFEKYSGPRAVGEIDTGCDQFKRANAARNAIDPVVPVAKDATRAVVELAAQRVKRDAEREHAPELDALSLTVFDLLVTLVNCLDRLDADQCDALRSHANRASAESASGSRRRLWQSLGRSIA
jgi:hypothetical protein